MELLVNQEGKIFGWMSKSDIVYTLRRVGNTIEFWPTRDYPERSEWGQKVTPTQPKSGDYITVSGVTYLMVFTRFAKGSDVSISPVPEDWDEPTPPTPPSTDGAFYRLVNIDNVNMNVVCDGAGNLGIVEAYGSKFLLRQGIDTAYEMQELIDGAWSGGTTIMATFDDDPDPFEWHNHEFVFNGMVWGVNPQLEEWTA